MYKMKKMHEGSWISHFIVPNSGKTLSPNTAARASELESASNGKSPQKVFSERIVPKNSDPRSFLLVTKSFLFADMDPVFFDPELDPPNKACFNCWQGNDYGNYKNKHQHYSCPKPKMREFCENCGRQGVDVTTCPRCARGYREFEKRGFKGKYVISSKKSMDVNEREENKVKNPDEGMLKGKEDYEAVACGYELENRDSEKEIFRRDADTKSENSKEDGFEEKIIDDDEDEDYDEIIVDENERSELTNTVNDTVQDFLNMMDDVKFLPIHTQSIEALKFVKERRERM